MTSKYESTNNISGSEEPVKQKRPTSFIYVLTFLSTIGGFLFGYDTGVVSGAMLLIRKEFNLSTEWHEAIVAVTIGAAWLFALIGGWLTDKVGRKPVILIASVVFTAGSIVMGVATTKEILLMGRVIVGVGIGLSSSTVLPVYSAESSPIRLRGKFASSHVGLITMGKFVASGGAGIFGKLQHSVWRLVIFSWMPFASVD